MNLAVAASAPKVGRALLLAGLGLSVLLRQVVAAPAGKENGSRPVPLVRAHAHNDYEHARPLLDALDQGFCSVEADVWLVNGRLLVAHDLTDARTERTLDRLYLEPLQERAQRNGGRVFPQGPTLTLLIDVKSDPTNTWMALRDVLKRHASMLTRFQAGSMVTSAVTVVISGNRARALILADTNGLAGYDGRLEDLASADSREFIPLISDDWRRQFQWKALPKEGPLPEAERAKLAGLVQRAHGQGRRLRLWGAPDNAQAWTELHLAGVDLINTDRLEELADFLRGMAKRPQ